MSREKTFLNFFSLFYSWHVCINQLESPTQIQKLFVHEFTTRFKSSHQNRINIDIDLPMIVSDEDNINLIKPVEDHEIKEAIF